MRLATRLSLAFAAAAVLPVVAMSPLLLSQVGDVFHDEMEARLSAAVRVIQTERDRAGTELSRNLDEVAASEEVRDLPVELTLGGDPGRQRALAGQLMAARGLDVLAILDGSGHVLSSGHLPARAGDLDADTLSLARSRPGVPVALSVERLGEPGIERTLSLVAARQAPGGLTVMVGRVLSASLVKHLSDVTSARVVLATPSGQELARADAGPTLLPAGALESLVLRLLPVPEGRVRTVPIAGVGGAPAAILQVSLPAQALVRVQARIAGAVAALLVAALVLAVLLGSILARRIVRPVAALAEGARAVAGGDLNHAITVRAGGELGQMVADFNRMTADLSRERDRAAVAERVAAWREVARRLAHEIKNPLTPIAMSIETLRDAWRSKSPELPGLFESSSGAMLEEVARLRTIVDEFSRFARLPPPQLVALEPSGLLDGVLALHPAPRRGLTLVREVEENLPFVLADPDQVTQVLLNLLKNADEALGPGGGTVRLQAFADGEAVVLVVRDDGPGIAPADLERIFEPYFSTKETGTGLGLPIARRIAEEHGGTLSVESEPGRGAVFRLRLQRS